jgi:hypothetical protein
MNDDSIPESLPRDPEEEARRAVEYEAALDEALDDTPRSAELRQLSNVLRRRKSTLQHDFEISNDPDERAHLEKLLNEVDEHIGVLEEEARINSFVEDTIKFSHEVRRLSEG